MTFGCVLRRGALAGVVAGLSAALIQWVLVEPVLQRAIALEQAGSGDAGGGAEALIGRSAQVVGGLVTVVVLGLLLGLIFAVALAAVGHRLPTGDSEFWRAVLLAAIGFGVVALLPALKYPANPPGVGDPTTVEQRTLLYGALLLSGVVITLVVGAARAGLARRGWSGPVRATIATAVAVLLVTVVLVLLPASPDQIPGDIPAALVWQFRLRSLAQQAVLWSVLGLATGLLLARHAATADLPDRQTPAAS